MFSAPHWRMKQLVGLYCDKVAGRGGPRATAPGREGGFVECAAVSAPAPPVTSALRCRGVPEPLLGCRCCSPAVQGWGCPRCPAGPAGGCRVPLRPARRGGSAAQGARRERARRPAPRGGAAPGPGAPCAGSAPAVFVNHPGRAGRGARCPLTVCQGPCLRFCAQRSAREWRKGTLAVFFYFIYM